MIQVVLLLLVLVLSACADPDPEALPEPPPLPPPVVETPAAPAIVPAVRAALAKAEPREAALVASPKADASSIALLRLLHHNAIHALRDLERDGGRHVTPVAVARARTAVKDLQNHLDEFQGTAP